MLLSPDARVNGFVRTRQRQDVRSVVGRAFACLVTDPTFTCLNRCTYSTLHHYAPKARPFHWHETADGIVQSSTGEPLAYLSLRDADDDVVVDLELNCKDEIARRKVDGRWRRVPVASDVSLIGLSFRGSRFVSPDGAKAYLETLCDLSIAIGGEYGWARHPATRVGNDFDRMQANDPFEPWFITWANLFGPGLVARFGQERLLTAPAHLVRELADGSILLTTAPSPLDELNPEVQDTIRRVKAHLGILSPSERATPAELAAFEARRAAGEAAMRQRIEDAFRRQREELAAEMLRQAEGCVESARRFWGQALDFTPASLAVVDSLIATGFRPDEGRDTVETAVQAFGAYVGEVVRRDLGGEWRGGFDGAQPILVTLRPSRQEVNPFAVVQRRFRERRQDDGFTLVGWLGALRSTG